MNWKKYPNTYGHLPDDDRISQPEVFDPALAHFRHGVRAGEPTFRDPSVAPQWRQSRRRVMDHVLACIGKTPWRENLVLRGSLVMKAWFGNVAREPGDADWIVQPETMKINSSTAESMLSQVIESILETPCGNEIRLGTRRVVRDDIWNYDRVPGYRYLIPWEVDALPRGHVQLDFVFCETLPRKPVQTLMPGLDGGGTELWTADKETSLAWKLLWLATDNHPQGKDLYDAVLLAENTKLDIGLLKTVMGKAVRLGSSPERLIDLERTEWEPFMAEYPWVQGSVESFHERLMEAIRPVFAGEIEA